MNYAKYFITLLFLITTPNKASSDHKQENAEFISSNNFFHKKIVVYDTIVNYNLTFTLLYKNVKGTIYHAVKGQTDTSPLTTADNSVIDSTKINKLRWVALSRNILNRKYRDRRGNKITWGGKIKLGDTIWIDYDSIALKQIASNKNLSYDNLKKRYNKVKGNWIVKDVMGAHYWQPIKGQLTDSLKSTGNYKIKRGKLHKKIKQDTWIDFLQDHKDSNSIVDSWGDRALIIKKREIKSIEIIRTEIDASKMIITSN